MSAPARRKRLAKVLEDAGIKLACVASDTLGVSGRAMLEALVAGTTDPQVLAELARGQLRKQAAGAARGAGRPLWVPSRAAGWGDAGPHRPAGRVDRAAQCRGGPGLVPFSPLVGLLLTIPGVDRRTAEVVLAEIGPDMGRFPSSAHLASWAGVCPGNHESAGKHYSARTRKGSKWLRTALVQAANAAARSKDTYLAAHDQRIKGRRGHHKAIVAVAHSILVIIWHLLTGNQPYSDLGGDYFVQRHHSEASRNGSSASWSACATRSPWSHSTPPDQAISPATRGSPRIFTSGTFARRVHAAGARDGQIIRVMELTVVVRSVPHLSSDVARGWHGREDDRGSG